MKIKNTIVGVLTLISLVLCFSCNKGKNEPDPQKDPVVYIAGSQVALTPKGSKSIASYWKDGVVTALSNGSSDVYLSSVCVQGNDIYVAGHEFVSSRGNYIAKYWKNGQEVILSDESKNTFALDVAVSENKDVYVCGYQSGYAVYWKNGEMTRLGNFFGGAWDIFLVGKDVYIAGYENNLNATGSGAVYWKNGEKVALSPTNEYFYVEATSIFVSGDDVYVAGYERNISGAVSMYWKNGVKVVLSDSKNDTKANDIYVDGKDVYVAGYESNGKAFFATYWKNGEQIKLTEGKQGGASASAIMVLNNNVYVAGHETDPNSDIDFATYWKNGVARRLNPDDSRAYANALYLVK